MSTPSIVDYFESHVATHAQNYREAVEALDSEGSGGNRRTVSNAAAAEVGKADEIKAFSERIVDRIAKEANGGSGAFGTVLYQRGFVDFLEAGYLL